MAEYRAYLVDSDGQFFDAVHLIVGMTRRLWKRPSS